MRKYLYIFKMEIMANFQYAFNILTHFIATFILLYIFMNLWGYIYSDPNEVINGFSMNQMIWYVIVTEVLWGIIGGRKFCKTIIEDVKGGNIAYNINKPYNYVLYKLASHLGLGTIRGVIYIILGAIVGYVFLREFPTLGLIKILLVLLTIFLSTAINTLVVISIGLISFYIEDSNPLYWLYSKTILIFGVLFPIEFFPLFIQKVLRFSPIFVTGYGPAKLFVDFSYSRFFTVLIAQLIYILVAYFVCHIIYKKGVRKLNVNGG